MGRQFILIADHLHLVSAALENVFNDGNSDIRLHTAKCLDVVGHSINTHLIETGKCLQWKYFSIFNNLEFFEDGSNSHEVNECLKFWLTMIPKVIDQIQIESNEANVKSVCCDALSNIGVHVYERLPVRFYFLCYKFII